MSQNKTGLEEAERIARWLERGRMAQRRTLKNRIIDLRCHWEAGKALKEWRDVLKEDGAWCAWLKAKHNILGFSTRERARHYINFHEKHVKPRLTLTEEEVVPLELALRGKSVGLLSVGGKDPNWFTQKDVIEAAREVMGRIDIDPASNDEAQETVKAGKHFTNTRGDNGLEQEWRGTVWLNPPYAEKQIKLFAHKLIQSYEAGVTTQAIWLSMTKHKQGWWQRLVSKGSILCLVEVPLTFRNPAREDTKPAPYQYSILYFGDRELRFKRVFSKFGRIYWDHFPEDDDYADPV